METTAEKLLSKTIEGYNKEVSQVYAFSFDSSESLLFENMMIEFAKFHVTRALQDASEKFDHYSNKNIILMSYPLSNIK